MHLTPDGVTTRKLTKQDALPYDLLLLADETIEIIDRYAKDGQTYVLEANSQIIAAYVLQVIDLQRIEIKNIAVDSNYQGQGIGKFMLRDATLKAKEQGYKTILIGTANGAIKQLYLYQKEGFEITSIKKNFFVNNYPAPIFENGILCKHMIMLEKQI
ncbi:GNAT family N-acetyltransferase [Rhodocytophaga rosea]|uniref:GNAT family N-acetyltransferase n=1 Tax=Rhodocytophaga rosea TaxID=2704465 RepID=A0A6C0GSS9_9BACT|nr:GNAT family N-acetyltransferase [Rhodocytophaga rosea]QHT71221.1 GNAT family N-acetyltransferase [Rhodocytophaga rosea]